MVYAIWYVRSYPGTYDSYESMEHLWINKVFSNRMAAFHCISLDERTNADGPYLEVREMELVDE